MNTQTDKTELPTVEVETAETEASRIVWNAEERQQLFNHMLELFKASKAPLNSWVVSIRMIHRAQHEVLSEGRYRNFVTYKDEKLFQAMVDAWTTQHISEQIVAAHLAFSAKHSATPFEVIDRLQSQLTEATEQIAQLNTQLTTVTALLTEADALLGSDKPSKAPTNDESDFQFKETGSRLIEGATAAVIKSAGIPNAEVVGLRLRLNIAVCMPTLTPEQKAAIERDFNVHWIPLTGMSPHKMTELCMGRSCFLGRDTRSSRNIHVALTMRKVGTSCTEVRNIERLLEALAALKAGVSQEGGK